MLAMQTLELMLVGHSIGFLSRFCFDLHATDQKHDNQQPLPSNRKIQLPKRRHRKRQHNNIRQNIDGTANLDQHRVVDAVFLRACTPQRIHGRALEDVGKDLSDAVGDDE